MPRCSPSLLAAVLMLGMSTVCRAQSDVADLREDVRGLSQRMGELSLRVEQLEHENAELKARLAKAEHGTDCVSSAELSSAVADLNQSIKSAVEASRAEILQRVATQMENLAKQTNAALDSLSKGQQAESTRTAAAAPAKAAFGDSYPKQGISYAIQKGDSIGLIARKTGAKAQDIIDANKILDPSHIQVGQTLFIPGGKAPP